MNKQELATKIWAIANELRKSIKASEYKDYILGFMFYKYLCDKQVDYLRDELKGTLEDLEEVQSDENTRQKFKDDNGYFIYYENLFSSWKELGVKLGAKDVKDAIDKFYIELNDRYRAVFDKVFNPLESGLSKLGENAGSRDEAVRNIVDTIDEIPPTSKDYDVLGYIYEYLIQQFSSEAKKDGAFYTPHALTVLMSRIIAERLKDRKEVCCYDPCVGSGGLLLNIGKEVGKYVPADNIKYYGQELISETFNLAKMNLFMQGVPVQNMNMRNADTLTEDWPFFDEQTSYYPLYVDAVISNPPYSHHWNPENHVTDERFRKYGLAPSGKADYAFLLHCLYHVKSNGVMAIVLPHGVLFRGGGEGEIRKNLILNHNIETIIGFPQGMFFSTGIPVVVIVLSKNRKSGDILFIDASKSYKKEKKQNVLRESDVQRIFDAVVLRKDIPHFAHLASLDEIKKNDFNLNIPRYVSADEGGETFDALSIMTGKISDEELDACDNIWKQFPKLRTNMFDKTADGYNIFKEIDLKSVVFDDKNVTAFLKNTSDIITSFGGYLKQHIINKNAEPAVYDNLVKKIFEDFASCPLVDPYAVFQAFADNWKSVSEDLSRIKKEGWQICIETEPNMITKKAKNGAAAKARIEVQQGYKGKIIPFDLVKKVYFTKDFDEANALKQDAESKNSERVDILDSLDDEVRECVSKDNEEASFDSKKCKNVIKENTFDSDVIAMLNRLIDLEKEEKSINKEANKIIKELDDKAKEKIESLTPTEVEDLLYKKWILPIVSGLNKTCEDIINKFASDMNALKKKYEFPLSDLSEQIEEEGRLLKESLSQLVGNDSDMEAIRLFMEEL